MICQVFFHIPAAGTLRSDLWRTPCKAVCCVFLCERLCRAAGRRDDGHIRAAGECIVCDFDNAAGESDLTERGAALKGRIGDLCDAVRNGEFPERIAVKNSKAIDGDDAVGKGDGCRRFAAVGYGEGAAKGHEGKLRIVRAGEGIAVIGQDTGGMAFKAAEPGGGASIKRIGMKPLNAFRNGNLQQICTAVERMRAEHGQGLRKHDLREGSAVLKGSAADGEDAFADDDLRKRSAVSEGAIADGCDGISAKRVGDDQRVGASGVGKDLCFAAADGICKISFRICQSRSGAEAQQQEKKQKTGFSHGANTSDMINDI